MDKNLLKKLRKRAQIQFERPVVQFWLEFLTLFIIVQMSSGIGKRVRRILDRHKLKVQPIEQFLQQSNASNNSENEFQDIAEPRIPNSIEVFDGIEALKNPEDLISDEHHKRIMEFLHQRPSVQKPPAVDEPKGYD